MNKFKDLYEKIILDEAKPRRAWYGKLSKIDDLLSWMYTNNILTSTEKKRKDIIFRKYYRYYNDGDFPKGLKDENGRPINKYAGKETIENALEVQVENFMKQILGKYLSKIDRENFRIDTALKNISDIINICERFDIKSLVYFTKKNKSDNDFLINVMNLQDKIKRFRDQINKKYQDLGLSNLVLPYVRELLQKDNLWDLDFENQWQDIKMDFIDIKFNAEKIKYSLEKAKDMKIFNK